MSPTKKTKAAPKRKASAKRKAAPKRAAPKAQKSTDEQEDGGSFFDQVMGFTDQLRAGALDFANVGKFIPLMFSDNWLKGIYSKTLDPERLQAMADAGLFLQDAREVAGLNLQELADAVGLKNAELLEEVEEGRATLPFDTILRLASLVARHDPIPFILKFVRTYNPDLEQRLDEWGILTLPKQYERERRYLNMYRRHDSFRTMSDDQFDRFIEYMDSASTFALSVMTDDQSEQDIDSE